MSQDCQKIYLELSDRPGIWFGTVTVSGALLEICNIIFFAILRGIARDKKQLRLKGFEPPTFGSVDRCYKTVRIVKTKT